MSFSNRHAALWINTSSKSSADSHGNALKKHLRSLYDRLLRTIEPKIGERHLVIVPHRGLYYLPFQALHDGESYLIERREVSFAPSAVVLQQCLARSKPQFSDALLLGVADERIPGVHQELHALDQIFGEIKRYSDEAATTEVLRANADRRRRDSSCLSRTVSV